MVECQPSKLKVRVQFSSPALSIARKVIIFNIMSSENNIKTEIENAKITNVSLTMADHGMLTFYITLEGNGWGTNYGGYGIGRGYLGAEEFSSSDKGLEAMMRIMDVVGVDTWEDLKGKFVRVKMSSLGQPITTIGNLIKNKWFDIKEFFKNS